MDSISAQSRISLTIDLDVPGRHTGDLMLRWSNNCNPLGYHPVPVISIKGDEGPVVLIIGGAHGDEFEGPAAIMRLAQSVTPEMLRGQIILLPALSSPAVSVSSRVSPLDGRNLNRAFPGDADGGPTAMLAHFVETDLMPRCDAVIDLHSGGKASFFQPCALATCTHDERLYEQNIALAYAFGLPLIWLLGANNDNRSINSAAERAGVPAISAELGGGGGSDPENTDQAEEGLLGCLRHLSLIEEENLPRQTVRTVEVTSPYHSIYAPATGLFDRGIKAGQDVEAGQSAGWFHFVTEPERPSIPLHFTTSGMILAHSNRGMVHRGDLLALVVTDTVA